MSLIKKTFLFCFCLVFISASIFAQSSSITVRDKAIKEFVDKKHTSLLNFYKELHAHPELSFQEKNTSARLANQLEQLGYSVTENIGGYGVVAVLKNGNGPTVMVRTDLDGLPVKEETGLAYASNATGKNDEGKEVPVMHACGHDVHMTVFTGVAQTLVQFKKDWKGTVVLVGQPAEERSGGAKAMLKEGLFNKYPQPDYCLALHMHANIPAGKVGYTEGSIMANVDAVDITIKGVGGHGAVPNNAKDPIVLAAQTVLALQTIVSRETPPIEPSVVTVGSIHGGNSFNVIPDEVKLQLTLRSYNEEVRNNTIASIKRICKGLAEAAGMPQDRLPVVIVRDQFTPFTYNDIPLTNKLTSSFTRILGPDNVIATPPSMVGEDFSFYGRTDKKIPICMYWLGAADPQKLAEAASTGKSMPSLHSSSFAPLPEPAIKTGVQTMATAVIDLLNGK